MGKITWSVLARQDLWEIHDYIAGDSPFYAEKTIEKFFERVAILEKLPQIGRTVPEFEDETIRELVEGNYRIVYWLQDKNITVLRVHHSARLLRNLY